MENILELILLAICVLIMTFDVTSYLLMYKELTTQEKLIGSLPLGMFWVLYKKNKNK